MFFKETYKNKKVFITGHTGFKGSWLLACLHMTGAHIKGYSLAPTAQQKLYPAIKGDSLCDSSFNDILAYEILEKSVLDFQPDYIFHLAAQPIVRLSYDQPLETFAINAIGTANVLNAARKLTKPCVVVIITTDKVYHNNEWPHPYRETDPLGGYDPYSASKACAELISSSYRNSFFNPADFKSHRKSVLVARAGNVIGGGDWARDRIIPDIVKALESKQPVLVRNPFSVRPWQHVLESVYAYMLLGHSFSSGPVNGHTEYNFGPGADDCLSVKEVVENAIGIWGNGSYKILPSQDNAHEAGLLKLDISRAVAELKWKPLFSAGEAISKTVNWYKNFDGANAQALIQADILSFAEQLNRSV